MRIKAGYSGPVPAWPDTVMETLVLQGRATVDGVAWQRGCYGFDALRGHCDIEFELQFYARFFLAPELQRDQ